MTKKLKVKSEPAKKIPKNPVYATSISCMDGRIQLPIIEYMKREYGADYVDIITEPGPIKYLAGNINHAVVETIKKRVKISVDIHGSKVIAVSGHYDCAGNPVDRKRQIKQIHNSIRFLKTWGHHAEYIGLWVDDKWKVRVLSKEKT